MRGRGRRGQRADAWASGCKHDAAGERRDEGRWVRRAKDGGARGEGAGGARRERAALAAASVSESSDIRAIVEDIVPTYHPAEE